MKTGNGMVEYARARLGTPYFYGSKIPEGALTENKMSTMHAMYGNCSYMAEIHYDREDCPYVSTEIYFTDIGKTVFLTQSEAEQKLNELAN